MNLSHLKKALIDTLPVMTGYVFLGFGFGILMYQQGYGLLWAVAMSLFIYAGSMQYVAVSLLASGASLLTAALTTALVNARHLFYGITMVDAYKGAGKKKPYLIFALTDETFSLVSDPKPAPGQSRQDYSLLVSALDHCYWVAGTALGSITGSLLTVELQGLDFALTALFVTIFTEQWLSTRDHKPAVTGVAATVACLLLFGADVFLIPSMGLIAGALILLGRKEGKA